MAQQNRPHKRTARDAGLSKGRTHYSLPDEKKRKNGPIVPIAIAAICALAIAGVVAFGQLGAPSDQDKTSTPATQSQTQGSTQADSGDKAKSSSSSKKSTKKSSSSTSGSKGKKSSTQSGAGEVSQTDSDDDNSTSTSRYADELAQQTQSGDDDDNWVDGDNGSYTSTDTDSSGDYDSSGSSGSSGSSSTSSSVTNAKGYSVLSAYCSALDKQSTRLSDFAEDTYNSHLYSKLSVREADYKAFKKLRKSILAKLQDKYAAWTVDSATVGSKLKKTKKKLSSASDLLLARLDIIENAYEKVNALGKKATKAQITKANKSALKDSASMYESFNSLLEQAQDVLG